MTDDADSLEASARRGLGESYERARRAEQLWVLMVWAHHRGDTARTRMVADSILSRARVLNDPHENLFLAAARARLALIGSDTSAAIDHLNAMPSPQGSDSLAWSYEDPLAADRMLLVELLMATARYREALQAASVFDHNEPVMFLPMVAKSLALRHAAALALDDRRAASSLRRRLQRLHREELIGAGPSTRR